MKDIKQNIDHLFEVPQDYFETLDQRIQQSLESADRQQSPKRSKVFRMYLLRGVAVAAMMAAVVFGVNFYQTSQLDNEADGIKGNSLENKVVIQLSKPIDLPIEFPDLEQIIQQSKLDVIQIDENKTIIIDSSAVAEYLKDNYDIMELATL